MPPLPPNRPTTSWSPVHRGGDAEAFDKLVVKYSPRLYGLIYHMTSNHEDTNDLMQDVFSKAFRSIGGFKGKSSFYTWLHQIGVNMTINFVKKRGPPVPSQPRRRRFEHPKRPGIPGVNRVQRPGAGNKSVGTSAALERGHAEVVSRSSCRGDHVRHPGHAPR